MTADVVRLVGLGECARGVYIDAKILLETSERETSS
jgi:hypothetical protein